MAGYSKIKAHGTHDGRFHGETVVIYIWTSDVNIEKGGESVGHAAIEILINGKRGSNKEHTYISATPDLGGEKFTIKDAFKTYPVRFAEDIEEDIDPAKARFFEGRKPDSVFILHTLKKRIQMKIAAKEIIEERKDWTLMGEGSCVSVVYKILVAGEIESLIEGKKFKIIAGASGKGSDATSNAPVSQSASKSGQSVVYAGEMAAAVAAGFFSPDYLYKLMMEAKKKDIERISKDVTMEELAGLVLELELDDGTTITEWTPLPPSPILMILAMLEILPFPVSILIYYYFFEFNTMLS